MLWTPRLFHSVFGRLINRNEDFIFNNKYLFIISNNGSSLLGSDEGKTVLRKQTQDGANTLKFHSQTPVHENLYNRTRFSVSH